MPRESSQESPGTKGTTIFDLELPSVNFTFLNDSARLPCPQCNHSVKYFCYKCHINIGPNSDKVPNVELPLPLDIIKHPRENNGKSTGIHAKLLAPTSTSILTYPVPGDQYEHPERCLLLFPSPKAIPLIEAFENNSEQSAYDRVVVIEGTWYQAHQMVRDTPVLSKMKHVTLSQPYHTVFWRFQQTDPSHLATIEAIYFLYRDLVSTPPFLAKNQDPKRLVKSANSCLENLLFYYRFFYSLIQHCYAKGLAKQQGRTFTTRHKVDYIQFDSSQQVDSS